LTIHLTLTVGLFSIVSMIGWLLFVPPGFWNSRVVMAALGRFKRLAVPETQPVPNSVMKPGASAAVPAARRQAAFSAIAIAARCAAQALCGVLLAYVILQNVSPLAHEAMAAAPQYRNWFRPAVVSVQWHNLGQMLTLNQTWDMFRHSSKTDGWYVVRAELADGERVDVLWNRAATDQKPELPSAAFPNNHWRYYFHYLVDDEYKQFRQPAAEFLCRRWNEQHGPSQQIVRLEFDWFGEIAGARPNAGGFVQRRFGVVERRESSDLDLERNELEEALRGLEPEAWRNGAAGK
jgi:hypothetical protein